MRGFRYLFFFRWGWQSTWCSHDWRLREQCIRSYSKGQALPDASTRQPWRCKEIYPNAIPDASQSSVGFQTSNAERLICPETKSWPGGGTQCLGPGVSSRNA